MAPSMYTLLITLAALTGGQAYRCGQTLIPPKATYIIGGEQATPHSWPWMVAILGSDSGRKATQSCGGSIINDQWVLTAAHCFDNSPKTTFSVGVGYHSLRRHDAGQEEISVERLVIHEEYEVEEPDHHDIALLKLSRPLMYSDHVQPVCLPEPGRDWHGETFVVTGWGNQAEKSRAADLLRQVVVPHMADDVCGDEDHLGEDVDLLTSFCAGHEMGKMDACAGDSGGPIVHFSGDRWVQAGVVSWGYGCARAYSPGVYTHVARFIDWIEDTIRQN